MEIPTYVFETPATVIVSGSTSCGKTQWTKRLLKHCREMMKNAPKEIYYLYGIWQEAFEEMDGVTFVEGIPSNVETLGDGKNPALVVIDDQMDTALDDIRIQNLFTRTSHHRQLTVILITQNVYAQGRYARSIALNGQYLILFRNPRGVSQVTTLARQIGMGKTLVDAYKDATGEPYGYLVIDLHPHNHSEYKLKSKVFPGEDLVVYL